jgi:hypothetical protein
MSLKELLAHKESELKRSGEWQQLKKDGSLKEVLDREEERLLNDAARQFGDFVGMMHGLKVDPTILAAKLKRHQIPVAIPDEVPDLSRIAQIVQNRMQRESIRTSHRITLYRIIGFSIGVTILVVTLLVIFRSK